MDTDLKDAIRRFDLDVEAEATRLIGLGFAPYDAMERARDSVSLKRRMGRRPTP